MHIRLLSQSLVQRHPFDSSMWHPQIKAFSSQNGGVLAPDLRGYGETVNLGFCVRCELGRLATRSVPGRETTIPVTAVAKAAGVVLRSQSFGFSALLPRMHDGPVITRSALPSCGKKQVESSQGTSDE